MCCSPSTRGHQNKQQDKWQHYHAIHIGITEHCLFHLLYLYVYNGLLETTPDITPGAENSMISCFIYWLKLVAYGQEDALAQLFLWDPEFRAILECHVPAAGIVIKV